MYFYRKKDFKIAKHVCAITFPSCCHYTSFLFLDAVRILHLTSDVIANMKYAVTLDLDLKIRAVKLNHISSKNIRHCQ